jgi:hypothetical protein
MTRNTAQKCSSSRETQKYLITPGFRKVGELAAGCTVQACSRRPYDLKLMLSDRGLPD